MRLALFFLSLTGLAVGAQPFNIRDFGAAGDGTHKDTAAFAKAIDTCAKAGGGTVYVPPGRYLTGAITLKSNVTLDVEAGAIILGSEDPADYPLRESPWKDSRQEISALIYGEDLHNITLRGRGTIDGQGRIWWERQWLVKPKRGMAPPNLAPSEVEKVAHGRPHLIKLVRCRNVRIEGLTLRNSPSWTVNPVFCEFLTVEGLTIINPEYSPNTDGINPESCRNVHIANCTIDVGDDCVTIKSGTNEYGRRMGKPCENITVTNCTMLHGHGGIVVGSEMSGGARNISVSNCVFQGTQRGVRIKSQRGRGGVVEGITVDNVVMQDVPEAISITMYYSGKQSIGRIEPVSEKTPIFRDILISNITARGSKSAGEIVGLREMPVSGITLSNVRISARTGLLCDLSRDLAFHNVEIDTAEGPALRISNTQGVEIDGFRSMRPHAETPVLTFEQVKDVFLRGSWASEGTGTFLHVGGASSSHILLENNDLRRARQAVSYDGGARRDSVTQR